MGLLGDPTRRAIFELLARGPLSVQQLADQLPISRPAVSQHLRVLKDGGLAGPGEMPNVSRRLEGAEGVASCDAAIRLSRPNPFRGDIRKAAGEGDA